MRIFFFIKEKVGSPVIQEGILIIMFNIYFHHKQLKPTQLSLTQIDLCFSIATETPLTWWVHGVACQRETSIPRLHCGPM